MSSLRLSKFDCLMFVPIPQSEASQSAMALMQERRSVAGLGMDIQRLTGADIKSRHWDAFYEFYINTTGTQNRQLPVAMSTVNNACGLGGHLKLLSLTSWGMCRTTAEVACSMCMQIASGVKPTSPETSFRS